jgi:stringent starvation protein B
MTRDDDQETTSTKPYLIRALHEWCTDNCFTPHLAVRVDGSVRVPVDFVRNNEIVLNVGFEATNSLKLGNDFIEFKARFGGVPREVVVPVSHVLAIYARENGQGMAFPPPESSPDGSRPIEQGAAASSPVDGSGSGESGGLRPVPVAPSAPPVDDEPPPPPGGPSARGGRPQLKRIK